MAWSEEERDAFSQFVNKVLYEIMTDEDYYNTMRKLGADINKSTKRFKTICHNGDGFNLSLKDKTFTCFSQCGCSYSLLSLVKKVKDCSTTSAMKWICEQNDIEYNFKEEIKKNSQRYNWEKTLIKYLKKENTYEELKEYDKKVLNYFENSYHTSWIEDNISIDSMDKYFIKYYNREDSIVIPCFDKNGKLIGIRQRYLNPNSELKYIPLSLLNGDSYKFPVNLTLYGMNYNSVNISRYKKCVIFESEKSVLQTDTMFGDNNFSLALYGKSMSNQKAMDILNLGVEEVIICLDADYDNIVDENGEFTKEFESFKKNVYRIGDYFKGHCKVTSTIIYDKHPKNCSPSDLGKEKYLELFNNRENLYDM